MFEIIQFAIFRRWLYKLKVHHSLAPLRRVSLGNLDDVAPVGEGVSEMRIFYGPGYRLYFVQEESTIIFLLNGGNKKSQHQDISAAKVLAAEWRNK